MKLMSNDETRDRAGRRPVGKRHGLRKPVCVLIHFPNSRGGRRAAVTTSQNATNPASVAIFRTWSRGEGHIFPPASSHMVGISKTRTFPGISQNYERLVTAFCRNGPERPGNASSVTSRIAVLDDYQNAARSYGDWYRLAGRADVTVFTDHLSDEDALAARLEPFAGWC